MTRCIGNKLFKCGAARNMIFGSVVIRAQSHVSLTCPIFHLENRIFGLGIGIHFQDRKDIFYNRDKRELIRLILTCFFLGGGDYEENLKWSVPYKRSLHPVAKRALFLDISNVDLSDACVESIIFFTMTEKHAKYDIFWVWGAVPP